MLNCTLLHYLGGLAVLDTNVLSRLVFLEDRASNVLVTTQCYEPNAI